MPQSILRMLSSAMGRFKLTFLCLVCSAMVLAALYSPLCGKYFGVGKVFNWRNERITFINRHKNPNLTTQGEPSDSAGSISSLSTDIALHHTTVAGDVETTINPETFAPDYTLGFSSYSTATLTDSYELKSTTSIKYAQQSNYSYTLPSDLRQAMQNRFLFPILHYGGGPSFQYRQLKLAIEFAVYTNRTIVLSDFRYHRKGYIAGRALFEDTFNARVFKKLMPAVSIQDFREKCGPRVRTAWTFYHSTRYKDNNSVADLYQQSRQWLLERANVQIPDVKSVSFPKSIPESWRKLEKTAADRCVVMVSPVGFESVQLPNKQMMSDAIDGHLVRTSVLQKAVVDVLARICDGNPILGFHWRNKTGEQCRIGKKGQSNDPVCNGLLQGQYKIVESIASHMSSIISQEETGCIFMASAPKEPRENVLRQLAAHKLSKLITIDDVINLHNPYIDTLGDDDYFISLIEQELCARSKVFVGTGMSNWSNFVFRERRAFQRGKNYDFTKDFPDILDIGKRYS
ncbi:uncharacterized protein [Ptychodera flava]|uniref:uncharacterized protein n=1 Tax=Ptychodera flava TaxID=63121 RepID=UPI003969F823